MTSFSRKPVYSGLPPKMPSRLQELLKNYKKLIATDPNIRNRLLAVVVLLFLLIVLVMFSMKQGFSFLEQSGSQLMVFVAINVNIVLLAIVFYLIARNLLKLSYERRRHVLGVNLKTKLITSFIVLLYFKNVCVYYKYKLNF